MPSDHRPVMATFQVGSDGALPASRPDLTVFRPSTGEWLARTSTGGYSSGASQSYQWGLPTDHPVAGDFDGDGRLDLVVYRPSDGGWYIRYSSAGYALNQWAYFQWGLSTDIPIAADFDGDGRSDLVVYRPSDGGWYIRYSSAGYALNQWAYFQWGLATDIPVAADFDGDGRTDLAVYRPSDGGWYIRYSSAGYALNQWAYFQWGLATDKPLVADFDGDGKSDLVVYRPSDGCWYIRYSRPATTAISNWACLPVGSVNRHPPPVGLRWRCPHGPGRLPAVERRVVHPLLVGGVQLRVFSISVGSRQRRADRAADALTRSDEPGAPSPQLSAGPSTCFHGANAFFTPSSERPSCG